jgi:hypothetical protein
MGRYTIVLSIVFSFLSSQSAYSTPPSPEDFLSSKSQSSDFSKGEISNSFKIRKGLKGIIKNAKEMNSYNNWYYGRVSIPLFFLAAPPLGAVSLLYLGTKNGRINPLYAGFSPVIAGCVGAGVLISLISEIINKQWSNEGIDKAALKIESKVDKLGRVDN